MAKVADKQQDSVVVLPIEKLTDFPDHPFKVRQDAAMMEMVESIKKYGILHPILVREKEGGYEIVAGHRRKMACELAGIEQIPAIIRKLDDLEAVIIMVDSNCQREQLLPSEKAKAYKMKLEAIKRQGERTDLTSAQVVPKLEAREIVANEAGENRMQITRYIRLNELIPPLLDMVDDKKMAFNPAVELSYLPQELQYDLLESMEQEESTPSLAQAQRLKTAAQSGKLDKNGIELVLSEEKSQMSKLILKGDTLEKFFPKSYTPKQMEEVIVKLLGAWQRKRQEQER